MWKGDTPIIRHGKQVLPALGRVMHEEEAAQRIARAIAGETCAEEAREGKVDLLSQHLRAVNSRALQDQCLGSRFWRPHNHQHPDGVGVSDHTTIRESKVKRGRFVAEGPVLNILPIRPKKVAH
jgi:hypothetical protein